MSIKESGENWVRGAPGQALILVAAFGIVVGGLAGLGAGFKIEQNRTRSDVKKLEAQLNGSGGPGVANQGTLGQRIGKVTATGTDTITLQTKRLGVQLVHTTSATAIEQLTKGKTSDILVGRRVLVTINGGDVIVLPPASRLGRVVTNVASDSFAIARANSAKGGLIQMSNVKTVNTVSPAKFSDVKAGATLLAGGKAAATKGEFNSVEVILLPPGSGFGG